MRACGLWVCVRARVCVRAHTCARVYACVLVQQRARRHTCDGVVASTIHCSCPSSHSPRSMKYMTAPSTSVAFSTTNVDTARGPSPNVNARAAIWSHRVCCTSLMTRATRSTSKPHQTPGGADAICAYQGTSASASTQCTGAETMYLSDGAQRTRAASSRERMLAHTASTMSSSGMTSANSGSAREHARTLCSSGRARPQG